VGTKAISEVRWEIDGQTFDRSEVPYEFSAGFHEATVRVKAGDEQVCTATVPIVVLPPSGSVPPLIVSEPPEPSECGQSWTYRPISLGTGSISWKLQEAPNGMTFDEATGELSWVPDPRLGRTTFTLTAVGDGAEYTQKVSLKAPCQSPALQTCGCGASGGLPAFAGAALLWLTVRLRRRGSRRGGR
jgi:uncharacterized protein (TIGR03382 family)